mmetsp:Transcript_34030/g.30818  ORF Transcript_34030/g.30818 Transcript_34030/m.30818 type:complete len:86 (+) Transcript_34030:461-718(+)|eukprot:CAMPEP_0114592156 /NCGR_PEP_ID=MMETSP0125-20121206/14057_1 /TAXON_ID=485358 ORGANISM="Aristerostoma sp., Strain ATCC 50986" /NCGR_SAMPLE_ID=MMETSP0125 /ASSEMBLY_ACC=CAM_ASM_000245 /LENGTH=85 /DNA_ID=CAMNT_0001790667 /DNA_START=461 /DNA_END=718 /DNA_ORIENTATION=-
MAKIDIDELEDLRDEMDDMTYESKQISDLLNRDYAVDVDDDDLDAELKELDDEMFLETLNQKESKKDENKSSQNYYSQIMSKNVN